MEEPTRFSGQLGALNSSTNTSTSDSSLAIHKKTTVVRRVLGQQVPLEIMNNQALNDAISILPANYNFEIHKTVWRVKQAGAKRVALQFPEGLLLYSCIIADILESFAGIEATFIMGDVTFGACCVDDYSAAALDADFLVHYGHSCLIPVDITSVPCMYVFVDIKMDSEHLIASIRHNFEPSTRIILAGTIQFAASIQATRQALSTQHGFTCINVPQSKPLSPGEVLGCTAPVVQGEYDVIVFVADGRFHLEALMIANPTIPAFRYDPYDRKLTKEEYDHIGMRCARRAAITAASTATTWGLVLGTLGRQGNPAILKSLQQLLDAQGKQYTTVLISEVSPLKLSALSQGVDAWVQIACPRLSIDWGEEFELPTLNPYEAFVALGQVPGWWEEERLEGEESEEIKSRCSCNSEEVEKESKKPYPMDYYSSEGGVWSSTYHRPKVRNGSKPSAAAIAAAARARNKDS